MWITDRLPTTPTPDPCDYRTQSAVVLIQTTGGSLLTARWTVYEDSEYTPAWTLCGRDGYQLEAADVAAWQPIAPFVTEAR